MAACEVMIYCFSGRTHGRKPDVVYVSLGRLPNREIPNGDIFIAPDLVVEVLSPGNTGLEVDDKLEKYLAAGVALVWIVNPDRRTIRVYRQDGTTHSFHAADVIEDEPVLPGFRLVVGDVFPAAPVSTASQSRASPSRVTPYHDLADSTRPSRSPNRREPIGGVVADRIHQPARQSRRTADAAFPALNEDAGDAEQFREVATFTAA